MRCNRNYAIMEGDYYLSFDVWHDQVIGIHQVTDQHRASRFESENDARNAARMVCYPRRLSDYQVVRC